MADLPKTLDELCDYIVEYAGGRTVTDPRPFLHWAGGKGYLLPEILKRMPDPDDISLYIEPFLGGGAVFFGLKAAGFRGSHILADAHRRLIATFRQVATYPKEVVYWLHVHVRDHDGPDYYYEIRDRWNRNAYEESNWACYAADMIYLSWCGFNGLWRENRSGKHNVAVGTRGKKKQIDLNSAIEAVQSASKALSTAQLYGQDFQKTLALSWPGPEESLGDEWPGALDPGRVVIYLDPPYDDDPVHSNRRSDTHNYTAGGFTPDDRRRLEKHARAFAEVGCHVVISDAWTTFVLDLYDGWTVEKVEVPRRISRDGKGRGAVPEALISSVGLTRATGSTLPLFGGKES